MAIKVFIGSEPKTEIAKKVLEFSILQRTKTKVVFPGLDSSDNWIQREQAEYKGVGTGFSLHRWDIPRRCDYKGFAIYLDADILCLSDIKDLWECDVKFPNEHCSIWCTYQKCKWFKNKETPETSVMLIDCFKAKTNQPGKDAIIPFLEGDNVNRERYVKIMRAFKHRNPPQRIPNSFNRLNVLEKGKDVQNRFLHYTIEPQQPWYNPRHPYTSLWEIELQAAIEAGVVLKEEIEEQVRKYRPHTNTKRGEGMNPYWIKYALG